MGQNSMQISGVSGSILDATQQAGIWTDNGFFHLVDSWIENDGLRNVFKFKLVAVESVSDELAAEELSSRLARKMHK